MATYTQRDFITLSSKLLGPGINIYVVGKHQVNTGVLHERTKGNKGVLVLGSTSYDGYYLTYIDLQKYVIHAHSTGGENMSADYFHLLSNFCVNHHKFRIHQHHNKAPLRYAGAFMLYAAQAYSKGKYEMDKHVNFEEVSQHYDSLINKKRYNKLKIERKQPTRHEDKNEGIGSRVRKFFADAVKDSTSRVIGDVVADRAFGNRKPSIARGIAKGVTSGVTRGIARGFIEHASKKFDNWSKARTDHEKIQDDHKKHKRIKIEDTDDDYTFKQSRDMLWKGKKRYCERCCKTN